MVEPQTNTAVTAIRSSEAEGFIASTLFSQGWSINFRALDSQSLLEYFSEAVVTHVILLISTDCEGLTPDILSQLKKLVSKVFLFQATPHDRDIYPEALPIPATALELIALMRGTLRSPLIRTSLPAAVSRRAKVFAIASSSGGIGCTTFALNLAAEIAVLGNKTLLLDAHPYSPTVATLLGQRGLQRSAEPRQVSHNIFVHEITQAQISQGIESLEEFIHEYDFLIIDLGTIHEIAANLSGRRWSGEMLIWVSNFADELIFLASADPVGIERLKSLTRDLAINSMKPALSFLQVQRPLEKRSNTNSESFLKLITPLKPRRILHYPYDARSAFVALSEETTLLESNEKSPLRKAIAHIAGEVVS